MLKVVSNSSPLIHLAKIGHLDLLKCFFDEIIVPEAVYNECVVEGKNREDAKKIEKAEWIKVSIIRDKNLKKALAMILDEGEAESIVLALDNTDFLIKEFKLLNLEKPPQQKQYHKINPSTSPYKK